MFRFTKERIYIRYGTSLRNESRYPTVKVSYIVRHRLYNESMINERYGRIPINDIAVLRLKHDIVRSSNVDYAKLPTYEFEGIFSVSLYGWGRMDINGSRSEFLLKTTMKTKRTSQCVNRMNPGCLSRKKCQHICAVSTYSGTGTGDSGGPIVFSDGTVVGLATGEFSIETNENNPPREERIFTRIFRYLKFIQLRERNHIIQRLN